MARESAQNDEQADLPVAEAGRICGQVQCGAQPIPEDEGAAPPRREDIATSGWVRLQVFSRRLPEAQRSNGVRLDFVPPFFGYIRLEADCLQVRQCVCVVCCFCGGLVLLHFVSPYYFGAVTAAARDMALSRSYDTSANVQPCGRGGKESFTQRGGRRPIRFAQSKGGFFPAEAACLLVTKCHRPSPPSKILSSGPSPCKGRMSSGRCVGRDTQPRQGTRHYDV
ncbi:hypothetical protein TcG_10758 [Trypanosoma cruzi]|nr:hypothetical protein TcG_10758 [Trypanosoma cruzi]